MIYLDVTSACLSPLNTGVKRMQRYLHSRLRGLDDYQPVVWQSVLKTYRRPLAKDLKLLEKPFHGVVPRGLALYDSFLPGALSDLKRAVSHRRCATDWPSSLRAGDLILVPDLLWDNRGGFFRKRFPPGVVKIGIFHDAIALTHPGQSSIDAAGCRRGVRALGHFDGVICLSETARKDLLSCWDQMDVAPVISTVIPWPVPFHGERPRGQLPSKSRELLYVARLEKRKNHLRLLEACERLWSKGLSFRLRLIGCKSYPGWTNRVLRSIRELQARGRDISWSAHVSDEELHAAYRSCHFTVFPSLAEGFGLPIIESLWHGRPVLCGPGGAVRELAEGGGCWILDVNQPDVLAQGIRLLLEDKQIYQRLLEECSHRKMLSWNEYWDSLGRFVGMKSSDKKNEVGLVLSSVFD